jgi:hypothetical protein
MADFGKTRFAFFPCRHAMAQARKNVDRVRVVPLVLRRGASRGVLESSAREAPERLAQNCRASLQKFESSTVPISITLDWHA